MHRFRSLLLLFVCSLLLSLTFSPSIVIARDSAGFTDEGKYPAHYFVFNYLANKTIAPESYQPVMISFPIQSLSESQLAKLLDQSERNKIRLGVLLSDLEGKTLFRGIVSFSPWLRGEFKSNTPEKSIDGHIVPVKSAAFEVRLPDIKASKLIFQDSHFNTLAEFSMDELLARTARFQADTLTLVNVQQDITGSPANRVDLVILGDGYTEAETDKFMADAETIKEGFFSISPLTEYRNYYNLYKLMIASSQSGSDHPPYKADCAADDPTCCGDPDMEDDPLEGQMVDTAFDSRYCGYLTWRLLVADKEKAIEAVGNAIPDWDQILLIVNDTTYGGSGLEKFAVVSLSPDAMQTLYHEYGHSFVDLADEYEEFVPGQPECSDLPGSIAEPCESNVTDVVERAQIKWLPWISDDIPVPTPEDNSDYYDDEGLFEGARYHATGMYRSGYDCLMRSLDKEFCTVPSQSYVLKLYQGGWGFPPEGIHLIEPDSVQPATEEISLTHPATVTFSSDILSPIGGPAATIAWYYYYDNEELPIPGAETNVYTFTTSAYMPGTLSIGFLANDVTSLVHPQMNEGQLTESDYWVLHITVPLAITLGAYPSNIYADGVSTSAISAIVKSGLEPLVGEVVTFTTTLGDINPVTAWTNEAGIATAVLTSEPTLGTATVSVVARDYNTSVNVNFVDTQIMNIYLAVIQKP